MTAAKTAGERLEGNVAWLVNAQDCNWATVESEMPGRDMRAGKRLRLQGGLAQIEFDQRPGTPAGPRGARSRQRQRGQARPWNTATARVPTPRVGSPFLSPRGKVVDLGTEFGLSVDDEGETTVSESSMDRWPLFRSRPNRIPGPP